MTTPSKSNGSHDDENIGSAITQLSPWNETEQITNGSYDAHAEKNMDENLNYSRTVDSWLEDIPWSDRAIDKVDPFRSDWPYW